jgi:hypothetical protein
VFKLTVVVESATAGNDVGSTLSAAKVLSEPE